MSWPSTKRASVAKPLPEATCKIVMHYSWWIQMIETAIGYQITKEELERFERALSHYKTEKSALAPRFVQVMKEAIQSTIDELRQQLADYEARQQTKPTA